MAAPPGVQDEVAPRQHSTSPKRSPDKQSRNKQHRAGGQRVSFSPPPGLNADQHAGPSTPQRHEPPGLEREHAPWQSGQKPGGQRRFKDNQGPQHVKSSGNMNFRAVDGTHWMEQPSPFAFPIPFGGMNANDPFAPFPLSAALPPGPMWPNSMQVQPLLPVHAPPPLPVYSQKAAAAALQKFEAAKEVQAMASDRAKVVDAAAEQARKMQQLRQQAFDQEEAARARRTLAEARAEATAQKLSAMSTAGAHKNGIPAAVPTAHGDAPSKEPEGQDAPQVDVSNQAQEVEKATRADKGCAEFEDKDRYNGFILKFNASQGFGFIQSLDVKKQFGCDAFFNQAVEGGTVVGGRVSFSLEISRDGKPQARQVILEAMPEHSSKHKQGNAAVVEESKKYTGRVKSFNAQRGFGFIECRNLPISFGGRDVFLSKKECPDSFFGMGQEVAPYGQEVEFVLALDGQGQPQAREVATARKAPPKGLQLFT